ncbi:MAG: hypothetical protein WDO70_05885 [Alphaproteobacteria bacterium]
MDIFEFIEAAADFCNRKRDTLYYSTLTAGAAAAAVISGNPHEALQALTLGISVREGARAASWMVNTELSQESRAATSAFMATSMITVGLCAPDPINKGFLVGLPLVCGSIKLNGLGFRQIYKLYADKLFDYPGKQEPPEPPSGKREKTRTLSPEPV